jgi:hypothetical protein
VSEFGLRQKLHGSAGNGSWYGLAVIHHSQQIDDHDSTTDFKALGCRLLGMSMAAWGAISVVPA